MMLTPQYGLGFSWLSGKIRVALAVPLCFDRGTIDAIPGPQYAPRRAAAQVRYAGRLCERRIPIQAGISRIRIDYGGTISCPTHLRPLA
jgi:hypothetical protein